MIAQFLPIRSTSEVEAGLRTSGLPALRPLRFPLVLAAFVVIISHGCHRDEIDTEPAVAPALHADRE